jgi:hypothetical protein
MLIVILRSAGMSRHDCFLLDFTGNLRLRLRVRAICVRAKGERDADSRNDTGPFARSFIHKFGNFGFGKRVSVRCFT